MNELIIFLFISLILNLIFTILTIKLYSDNNKILKHSKDVLDILNKTINK